MFTTLIEGLFKNKFQDDKHLYERERELKMPDSYSTGPDCPVGFLMGLSE